MSSFTYYNNQAVGNWPNAQTDPQVAQEYYNYLSGSWKDGTPFTYGGSPFQVGGTPIDYAFTEARIILPAGPCVRQTLDYGDRRIIRLPGHFAWIPEPSMS
ncbi:MAG: hypothetical protein H6561_21210 [Lewinellaceae bacterium]|nr:hypothetical protein [Lewinellaceae bacterium]